MVQFQARACRKSAFHDVYYIEDYTDSLILLGVTFKDEYVDPHWQ